MRVADHALAGYRLEAAPGPDGRAPEALFCENETNLPRVFGAPGSTPYPKDGINDHVVGGAPTVNPDGFGTKAALRYRVTVAAGVTTELRLRLHRSAPAAPTSRVGPEAFDTVVAAREADADEFYAALAPAGTRPEGMRILRQASAGLVWSKQIYPYDVARWLDGDPGQPPPPESRRGPQRRLEPPGLLRRPRDARPLGVPLVRGLGPRLPRGRLGAPGPRVRQVPDAGAAQGVVPAPQRRAARVRVELRRRQPTRPRHGGPAGLPRRRCRDRDFLERVFQKLLVNFTWWLNRQDPDGNNVFGGGFLGLDNISPLDRSNLPDGVRLEQADGTAWMAYYALSMLVIAVELAADNEVYEDMVVKFLEQFLQISKALDEQGLYDAADAFFYDRLVLASGEATPVKVRTVTGLIPLLPAVGLPRPQAAQARLGKGFAGSGAAGPGTMAALAAGPRGRRAGDVLVSVLRPDDLRVALREFLDEAAFLSPHGVRAVSRRYGGHPYTLPGVPGATIDYEPAESTTAMFGGNSNWRGPVWMPVNYLVVRQFAVCTDSSATTSPSSTPRARAGGHVRRGRPGPRRPPASIWLPDDAGRRPVFGGVRRLQEDPAWKDNLLFFEYFHGDDGAGLGAMHQTGWTALVVDLILDPPGAVRSSKD